MKFFANQIYSLLFDVEDESEFKCQAGDPRVGIETVIPNGTNGGNFPAYIYGKVLTSGNGALQSLNFLFKD